MPLSFAIASFLGTIIRVHVVTPLFFIWLWLLQPEGISTAVHELSLLVCLFVILVHEAAHFAAAIFQRIPLREVAMYPFGARYQFRELPERRTLFLFNYVAVATSALCALAGASVLYYFAASLPFSLAYQLEVFCLASLALALVNLCPCTPLDGGGMLQGILQQHGVRRSGSILSRTSQIFCFVMAIATFFFSAPVAIALSIVLLLTSFKDRMEMRIVENAVGLTAQSAAVLFETVQSLPHNTTVSHALQTASVSAQEIFPVFYESNLIGFVDRGLLLEAAASDPDERYLTEIAIREKTTVPAATPLTEVVKLFVEENLSLLIVTQDEKPIGFIVKEVLLNFLVVKGIQRDQREMTERDSDMML